MTTAMSAPCLDILQRNPTLTVANAIESFGIRPRNAGYPRTPFHCLSPEPAPAAGYAVTRTVSREAPDSRRRLEPGPRIAVLQDLDRGPWAGGFPGEVLPRPATAIAEIERRGNGAPEHRRTRRATRAGLAEAVTRRLRSQPVWKPEAPR
jgi:hypothetical protein